MGIFDRLRGGSIRIHLLIKGRIGDDWKDIDEYVRVPAGTTLGALLEITDAARLPLREALAVSPHLTDTMMLNGERCPLPDNEQRVLADGDEIYLLAPLAGG
ncbi:MAG TPA: MoaD/ThiS family protein [Kofleriaceae bacterium]|nr:MoaD/ThiS family protein [Kofleriaceae bacterium]